MASATLNCSPKTFSPRVLIHRTEYNGLTNTCKLGKPNIVLSRKSFTTSPIHVGLDRVSITKTSPVEFELRNTEPNQKQPPPEGIKTDRETSKISRDLHVNNNGVIDHKLTIGSGSDVWNEARIMSQFDPPLKYISGCCKCCSNNFTDACIQKPKDARDFRTILPQFFKIKDEHFYGNPKSDSLRWTLFNSKIVNRSLINLSCNGMAPFGGPFWSNRWIYPDLDTYADHFKDEIKRKESTKYVSSVANNAPSLISSSRLTKTLPIDFGNTCYNACDGNNVNRVFLPLLSQKSTVLPVPTCAKSLSFTVASSTPSSSSCSSSCSSPPPACTSASSSVSSMCLFRRESFFSYDRKPLICNDLGSYGLQTKLKRDSTEDDESAGSNKRFKFSDEKNITAGHYYSNVPFVNSITAVPDTKHNGMSTTKTTSIYKVPKDSVNEKRQIQKSKNFHCPFCNISCSNRGQLQGHVRIHTGERPFVCQEPQCGKAFIRNEELTRHRRIHTGERPHICPICKKAFTRKDHLSKHMKTHT